MRRSPLGLVGLRGWASVAQILTKVGRCAREHLDVTVTPTHRLRPRVAVVLALALGLLGVAMPTASAAITLWFEPTTMTVQQGTSQQFIIHIEGSEAANFKTPHVTVDTPGTRVVEVGIEPYDHVVYEFHAEDVAAPSTAVVTAEIEDFVTTMEVVITPGAPAGLLVQGPEVVDVDDPDEIVLSASLVDSAGNRLTDLPALTVSPDPSGPTHLGTEVVDGEYRIRLRASNVAGEWPVLLEVEGTSVSSSPVIVQRPGPLHTLGLDLAPSTITADGTSTTVATVTASDVHGNAVALDSVDVTTDAGLDVAVVPSDTPGHYVASLTSTTTAGEVTVTARGTAGGIERQTMATLAQVAGAPRVFTVALAGSSVVADGAATTLATATVTDEHGNVLPGLDVQIEASGGQAVGPVTDHGDGTYSAEVTATTVAGEFEVTATVAGLDSGTGSATLTQVAGAPADVELVVSEWVAGAGVRAAGGGTASFEAVATVTDTFGNFVPGADVRFATDGPQSVGPVTEDPVGRYAVRIDSPRGVGELIVTVSAGDVAARVVVPVPPAQAPGEEAPNEGEAPEEEAPDEEAPDDDGAADDETRGDDDASNEDELATTGASLETLSLAAIFLVAGVLFLVISGAGLRLAAREERVP